MQCLPVSKNANLQLVRQFCKVSILSPLKVLLISPNTLYQTTYLLDAIYYSYLAFCAKITTIPITNQKIVANFDASKTSKRKALINIPGRLPQIPAINPISTPLKFLLKGKTDLNFFAIPRNIKAKAKNPTSPTSPKSLKKSLSVANVIEENPVPTSGFLAKARSALGHSTFNLIEVERSSNI